MPLADEYHADQLIELARNRYAAELQPIELQIIRHSCRFEDPPDWHPAAAGSNDEIDVNVDPTGRPLVDWEEPELRPSFLRWLLTDTEATALLEHRGLRVRNARLCEPLDLRGCRIPVRIEFRYCIFLQDLNLISAEVVSFYLMNSSVQGAIEGSRLKLHGPFFLRDTVVDGRIQLDLARVEAEVYLGNTTLTLTSQAMSLSNAVIDHDVRLNPSFRCSGGLAFERMRIGGSVNMNGAKITASEGKISLDQAPSRAAS